MGMELFELAAKVALDKGDFDKGVQEADDSGKALADNLSKYFEKAKKVIAGLFTVAAVKKAATAVWDLAKTTSAAGDRIDKVSQSIGFSRKKFQEWDYILSQNGASIDDLGLAMKTLDQAIVGNSAEASAALSKLGLSAAHLASLSPEEQFEKVVAALQKMPDGADKSRIALQLFGKNAQSLMPLLNSSAESVEELRQRAHDLGLIMSDEDVDASVAFGDALDDLNKVWSAVQMKFGAKILPMLTKGLVNVANLFGKLANAVQDALVTGNWGGVFDVIKNAIHWPTWPEVRDAAIRAWEGIKAGALSLAGLVFGKKEDGTVNWPTWDTVSAKATEIWNAIKAGALTLGGLVFGKKADGSVDWPTWDDVKEKAIEIWNGIKAGAQTLGGLIFGKKADGSVDWPTWDDVKEKATEVWNAIKAGALTLGGLVFGKKADGTVDWPTWDDVSAKATEIWNGIKAGALTLGGLVFGKKADGTVDWPTWDDVKGKATEIWDGIKAGALTLGGLVFGKKSDGTVDWPTWDDVSAKATEVWNGIKAGALTLAGLVFGKKSDGTVDWPTWDDVSAKATEVWNGIKAGALTLCGLVFGKKADGTVDWPTWDDVKGKATEIWNAIKAGALTLGGLVFGKKTDGTVDWPTWDDVSAKATEVWNAIKAGALTLGGLVFGKKGDGSVNWPTWEDVKTKAEETWRTIVENVAKLPGTVSNLGDEIYKAMMGDAAEAIEAGTGWSKIGEAIVDKIEEGLKFGKGLLLRMVFGDDAEGKTFYDLGKEWAEQGNASDIADGIFDALVTKTPSGETKGDQLLNKIFGDIGDLLKGYFENTDPWDVISFGIGKRFGEEFWSGIEEAFSGNILEDIAKGLIEFFESVENFINDVRRFFGWDVPEFKETFDFSNGLDFGQFGKEGLEELNEYINAYNTLLSLKEKLSQDPDNVKLQNAYRITKDQVQKSMLALQKDYPKMMDYFFQYLSRNGQFEYLEDSMPSLLLNGEFDPSVPSALQEALNAYHLEVPVSATIISVDASALTGFSYGSSSGGNFGGSTGGGPPLIGPNDVFYMNAKGDSYVPYDNYPALLHRGEAVLTADQARNWRNGRPDGIDADMLYNAVAEAVAAAVGSIQVNMDGAAVGNMVTNQVSRNMYRKQAGRRYGVG